IYDLSKNTYRTVDFGEYSTTLYGIWQNGGSSSTKYTIVGGFSGKPEAGKAFIVNYDSATHQFSHFQPYSFNNGPTIITHFEGITAFGEGFSVAATSGKGASYAFIEVRKDGSFGAADWVKMRNRINETPTTGDTVIDTSVMGVYPIGNGKVQSYISNVRL